MASEGGAGAEEPAPHPVQRDHQDGRAGGAAELARRSTWTGSTPSRRGANWTGSSATRSARCLSKKVQPRLSRRARPVGRRAADRRPRARDPGVQAGRILVHHGDADAGHGQAQVRRGADRARRQEAGDRATRRAADQILADLDGGDVHRQDRSSAAKSGATRRRRSSPAPCSRKRRASSASRPRRR